MVKKIGIWKKDLAKRGPGKPQKILDERQVYELARTMMSVESMAIILGCCSDTLYAKYSDSLQRGRENRKQSLAEAMWQKAIEGKDTTMMIWLSKQHLGHRDKQPDETPHVSFNVYTNEIPR